MALSDLQKAQIHRVGGYSERDVDAWNSPARQIKARLEGLSAPIEAEVVALLGTTADAATAGTVLGYEKALLQQDTRLKARRIGSIELSPVEPETLREKGSARLEQLFRLLGLEVISNPFYPGGAEMCLPGL